jgi:hypothetical protein
LIISYKPGFGGEFPFRLFKGLAGYAAKIFVPDPVRGIRNIRLFLYFRRGGRRKADNPGRCRAGVFFQPGMPRALPPRFLPPGLVPPDRSCYVLIIASGKVKHFVGAQG